MIERKDIKSIFISGLFVYMIMLITSTTYMWAEGRASIFILSTVWMVVVIPLYMFIKKPIGTLLFLLVNSIIAGLTISVYYINAKEYIFINPIVGTGFMLLLVINSYLIQKTDRKRRLSGVFSIVGLVLMIMGLTLWFFSSYNQGSWIVFSSIIVICINGSIYYWLKSGRMQELFLIIRHYNMLMFGGVFFVVIAAISEGDSLDLFLNAASFDDTKKKK